MKAEMDFGTLLNALQQADLMATGCLLNDGMQDEYWSEASQIVRLLAGGASIRDAVITTFEEHFWVGCLMQGVRSDGLDRLVAEMDL